MIIDTSRAVAVVFFSPTPKWMCHLLLDATNHAVPLGVLCVQIAAGEVEKAVEEALMQEVERKQQQLGAGAGSAAAPGFAGPQASSHVQNVF